MNATGNEQMKARRNPRIILFRLAQKCCHNDPDWSDSIIDPITSVGDANTFPPDGERLMSHHRSIAITSDNNAPCHFVRM